MFQQQQDDSLHIFYVSVAAGGVWVFACSATVAAVDCEFIKEEVSDAVLAVDVFLDDAEDVDALTWLRTAGVGCDGSCWACDVDTDSNAEGIEAISCEVAGTAVGVCGGKGESIVILALQPVLPLAFIFRVRNQQFMGVGFPFITTGPRYSRWNESSWLISWQSNLQMHSKNKRKIMLKNKYMYIYSNSFKDLNLTTWLSDWLNNWLSLKKMYTDKVHRECGSFKRKN